MQSFKAIFLLVFVFLLISCSEQKINREALSFNHDWQFAIKDDTSKSLEWRTLDLPHDWSIEGEFSPEHPTSVGGGALPGGLGYYRKEFTIPDSDKGKAIFLQFDGVYQKSTVSVNGRKVGYRPNGYISFEYDITSFLNFGDQPNVIEVEVDNSQQPNSRWYSGSGIYRNVRLVKTPKLYFPQYAHYITSDIDQNGSASINVKTDLLNKTPTTQLAEIKTAIIDINENIVAAQSTEKEINADSKLSFDQQFDLTNPELWSIESPNLYKVQTQLFIDGELTDEYMTDFGIRSIRFDADKGFFLNENPTKIKGVCLHHDLGALGAAINIRAMERQLEIMKSMGVNAIRTSHNPPAPEFLDLCDRMGFLVMDEMFDMWVKGKTMYDYSLDWEDWHKRDLEDFIIRDRNHPSVIVWSVGNEVIEQYDESDSLGGVITKELTAIVRSLDPTRPTVTANNSPGPGNPLIKYGDLDLLGYNYHHEDFVDFQKTHPGGIFIATETNSSLATRGHYDMPSDSVRIWPEAWDKEFKDGNPNNTVSAYDNVRTPWGSLQEETWSIIKNNDYLSGMFIWTGFDYLGEPTPYIWPSRSSYFGIVDLAGFPKDTYYMYQSEWTRDTVLHLFPHWNWTEGQEIDVWAYYNQADEVELFLNGQSMGTKSKEDDQLHVQWRLTYTPGELKAISRKDGETIATKTINTAGSASRIKLQADRDLLSADGEDLSFITVSILDNDGNLVPDAAHAISFEVTGAGYLRATDNGNQTSHESFQSSTRKAFNGKCLAIIQSNDQPGDITITAKADELETESLTIRAIDK